MATLPAFNKLDYWRELWTDKQKAIAFREFLIFALEKGLKDLPASPTKDRDTVELNAEISRYKDEIEGLTKDAKNIELLIGQNEPKA